MSSVRDRIKERFTAASVRRDAAYEASEKAETEKVAANREFDEAYAAWERVWHRDMTSEGRTQRPNLDAAARIGDRRQ